MLPKLQPWTQVELAMAIAVITISFLGWLLYKSNCVKKQSDKEIEDFIESVKNLT